VGSATDGLIAARDMVVLEDDRHYFPPYDAVIVANAASLRAARGLETALRSLSGRIDAAAMQRLNFAVDGAHKDPRAVAKEFLRTLR
jgi:glycine betaine/choline ABC-type transport system substrate-binding protein